MNYISHHAVFKDKESSTPFCIVSNLSLDNNNLGNSYNGCLAKGPNSLTPLLEVLVTWRAYLLVFAWDIKKAYNALLIALIHHHMRQMVWRLGDVTAPFQVHSFARVRDDMFGARQRHCPGYGEDLPLDFQATGTLQLC